MANRVFVFCIGGTGLRVMKAITMLAASGVKTNGYTIVPIIIDPHIDLDEKTKVDNLINDYIRIYKNATTSEGQQMNPWTDFSILSSSAFRRWTMSRTTRALVWRSAVPSVST